MKRVSTMDGNIPQSAYTLREVLDNIIIYVINPKTMKIIHANQHFKDLLKHDPTGSSCHEILAGRDKPCPYCSLGNVSSGERKASSLHYNEKFQKLYWFNNREIPFNDELLAFNIAIDITALEETRKELEETRDSFETLLDSLPQKIFLKDKDSVYISCNNNYAVEMGIKIENIAGKTDFDFYPEKLAKKYISDDKYIISTGKGIEAEEPYIKDGTKYWVHTIKQPVKDEHGNITGVIGIFWDITEAKQARFDLEKNQWELNFKNKLTNAFITIPDKDVYSSILAILMEAIRCKYGVFGYINESGDLVCPTMTREVWSECNIPGKDIVYPEETWGNSIWARSMKEKKVIYKNEKAKVPEGHIPIINAIAAPIINQGQVIGMFNLANKDTNFNEVDSRLLADLADYIAPILNARLVQGREEQRRLEAERDLDQTLKKLKASNQDLEQFAYVASHDLQEPLRMISSFTQLLAKKFQDIIDENAKDYIEFITDGTERMTRLINDLLQFSRISSRAKEFSRVNIQDILDIVKKNLSVQIDATGAKITSDPLPKLSGDETQLIQIFQNLISNALKFRGDDPPEIHVSSKEENGFWIFSIADNGIGIEKKDIGRLFMIFKRLHSRKEYPGTGIGLASCKKIVERHGGRIWVESEKDDGSTFYFSIPKYPQATD
ncbi:PAS domain-containing protein [Candidatus Bathyarchaeota archaeon]|nr:PAS domain-containing protein [Candidatus Bathyarchaeota archaeon]